MKKNLTHVKRITKYSLVILLLLNACKAQENMIDKSVVKEFDLNRYMGTWYEIARFNHSFERGLIGVTASYSLRDDGKINVINSGFKGSFKGQKSEAVGKAKIPNPKIPSKLKVSFFWFFYGDYYVMELDENYQWGIIGSSSDKYLWILSRHPHVTEPLYNKLLEKVKQRGYDVSQLIRVEQKVNQNLSRK